MDRLQHIVQDASEHYAVFIMQTAVEEAGLSWAQRSKELWATFLDYLAGVSLDLEAFSTGKYSKYKTNTDSQAPSFAIGLARHFGKPLAFRTDEAQQRNLGNKADFFADLRLNETSIPFSLKNYIGASGITRPQVASGTFLSFANSFVFSRAGVGKYVDPRFPDATFQGSNRSERNAVLSYEGRNSLIRPLEILEDLNSQMREILLGPNLLFYDEATVKQVIADIVTPAHQTILEVLDGVGLTVVKDTILARSGMDGSEEAFFFDAARSLDSITNIKYRQLRQKVQSPETTLVPKITGQSIRFAFTHDATAILNVDIPFTVNTNGAWHRPAQRYEGTKPYNDKGEIVNLAWGQRRPRKSREIATSVNTYVDLRGAGLFDTSAS